MVSREIRENIAVYVVAITVINFLFYHYSIIYRVCFEFSFIDTFGFSVYNESYSVFEHLTGHHIQIFFFDLRISVFHRN